MSEPKYRPGTLAVHAGQEKEPTTGARAVPIYATASYVFESTEHAADLFALKEFGNIYSRLMNPTNDVLEKRLAALDGGAAGLAFASGQAAITAAILTICHSGQNFVSATSLYGGTWTLFTQTFKKLGIEVRFFDPDHPEEIDKASQAQAKRPSLLRLALSIMETVAVLAHSFQPGNGRSVAWARFQALLGMEISKGQGRPPQD